MPRQLAPVLDPTGDQVVIFHNPACSSSRKVLALIRDAGFEPRVVDYQKTPPDFALLQRLAQRGGIPARALLRTKSALHDELGLSDPSLSDDALLAAIATHPILLERPLVATATGAAVCRPIERVLGLLPAHTGKG